MAAGAHRFLQDATSACCSATSSKGLKSEREIAWRCADSLSLHRFLRLTEGEAAPDHSTLSVTRSRLPLKVHHAVFGLLLEIADKHALVRVKRIGVDASTQQANAAPHRLVRPGYRRGLPGDAAPSSSRERHRDTDR